MKRFGQFLLCFVPFFAAQAIQIVTAIALSFIYLIIEIAFYLIGINQGNDISFSAKMKEVVIEMGQMGNSAYLISMISIIVCGIVFFFWYRKLSAVQYKGKILEGFTFYDGIYILLLGIGCQIFISGAMGIIQPFIQEVFEDYAGVVDQLMGASPILVLIFVVIVAPIVEELIFRGVMMFKLEKQISFLGANLLQGLVFGIYHMNWVQGVYGFILGLVLGYIAHKYNSIIVAIILHSIINGLAFVIAMFGSSLLLCIVYLCLGALCITFSIYQIHKRRSK